jgi:hypothetical protein
LALRSITIGIKPYFVDDDKTKYNNDAMWCLANDQPLADFYAHIEGTYNNGRFIKNIRVETDHNGSLVSKQVIFYCTFKYDYMEALNHLPTDYLRPNEIAQAAFIGKTKVDPKTKNNCCDGTY